MALLNVSPPTIELVTVAAGEFVMGQLNDKFKGSGRESPSHLVMLQEYQIGRYPVTNAQYLPFVQDTGHPAPTTWADQKFPEHEADHPVSGVTWADAWLYCAWLRRKTQMPYHLPTEAQWEKAATWNPATNQKQPFPWGEEWNDQFCNSIASGINNTTPVGTYSPQGDSPYGCADMLGNVDEWCNTAMYDYPYQADDGCEELLAQPRRAIRGGDWYSFAPLSAIRRNAPSDAWVYLWGFRVACSSALDEAHQKFVQDIATAETTARNNHVTKLQGSKEQAKLYASWGSTLLNLRSYGVERFAEIDSTLTKAVELIQKASTGFFRKQPDKILGFPYHYVYYNRALARQELGNYEGAFQDLVQAEKLNASDPDVFILRAAVACDLKRWQQAEADLAATLRLAPEHPHIKLTQIRIAMAKEDWGNALVLLTERINAPLFNPLMRPDFHLWRADIHERKGDREKAISDYYHYLLWRPDGAGKDKATQKIQEYLRST